MNFDKESKSEKKNNNNNWGRRDGHDLQGTKVFILSSRTGLKRYGGETKLKLKLNKRPK